MTRGLWRLTLLWLALIGLPAAASAQISQAELRGVVHDESGASLPGATIVATHIETGASRTTTTTETGSFIMPSLPVGEYKVRIEMSGFQAAVHEGVRLAVGQSASLNFTLKVATLEEVVTVASEAPLVETKRSELAGRVEPKQVENLPLNGRNWLDLVGLVPGARGTPGTASNIQAGAAGNDMTKYQMDGQDVGGQCCGGTNQSYSQEIIAEFQVLTNRFDAEYGRAGGAVISAVTKTGTNQLRATGFGFLRDDEFDAPNVVANRVLPFHESQMGLTVGGPILRDRAHFFGSYERQARDASTAPNTRIAQFDTDVSQDARRHLWTGRGDVQVNQQHRAFARASYYDLDQINQGVGGRATVSNGYSYPIKNTDLSVGETWVISDRLVHEIRTGFSYIDNALISNSPTVQYSFPSAVIGSPTNSPQWWKEMNVQFNNSLSYFVPSWHGEHSLRAGFQYFRPKFWGELPQQSFGAFNFARDPSDFNNPATYPPPTSFSINLGDFAYSAANPTYAAFVQDNWSITSKLSLNLGVRYDVESGVKNTDFENPVETGERSSDADNIAPRVGFAYDVRGDGRTVVRGGYGRYYDKVLLNITTNERRQVTGQFIAVTVQNPSLTDPLGGLTFDDYKNQNRPRNITVLGNDFATPRADQVSIGMAQQIGTRYALQADFVHTKGVNEPRQREVNQFEDPDTHLPRNPAQFGRPFPQYVRITRYETSAKSKYDGLQLGFTGRSTAGRFRYQYQGSYILSKTYDDHTGNRFSAVNNPFNLADEYAYASTDQRHRFIANVLVNLPYDLNVSAIYFAGSKRPTNVTSNQDPFGIASSSAGNGRWLNAAGEVVERNSERTLKNDYKLDLRLSKTLRLSRVRLEGIVDAFNVLDTGNISSYGNVVGSAAYLTPNQSAAAFYQPRQIQFGFRVSY
jgi:hypothetical protein